jgi:hypothetical protein
MNYKKKNFQIKQKQIKMNVFNDYSIFRDFSFFEVILVVYILLITTTAIKNSLQISDKWNCAPSSNKKFYGTNQQTVDNWLLLKTITVSFYIKKVFAMYVFLLFKTCDKTNKYKLIL